MDLDQLPPEIAKRLPGWKAQYGELIYVPYEEMVAGHGVVDAFVFKPITLNQYDQIKVSLEFDNALLIDEVSGQVMQACMLWPENLSLDELPQTDFKRLYKKLSEKSPFNSLESFADFVERARNKYSDLKSIICAFIAAAFPTKSMAQIGELEAGELGQYLIAAEHILQRPFEVPGVKSKKRKAPDVLSPDEVKAARHLAAAQRREQAIDRAQDRRRQRYDALDRRARGLPPLPPGAVADPTMSAPPRSVEETRPVPMPAATPPPSMQQEEGMLHGVDRVGHNVPLRRASAEDILDEDEEPMMDKDFKHHKREIDKIWNNPEDVRHHPDHDGPIILGG